MFHDDQVEDDMKAVIQTAFISLAFSSTLVNLSTNVDSYFYYCNFFAKI